MPKSIEFGIHLRRKSSKNVLRIDKEKNHQLTPMQIQFAYREKLIWLDYR
jgi:hypothetical protein